MTNRQAAAAMKARTKVEAGVGDDHDTGVIVEIDGDTATVAWDSGVRTPCPIRNLSRA